MVDFHLFRNKQVSLSICVIVTAAMIGCTAAGCSKGPATSITSTKTAVTSTRTTVATSATTTFWLLNS
jgi:hypothetical protein